MSQRESMTPILSGVAAWLLVLGTIASAQSRTSQSRRPHPTTRANEAAHEADKLRERGDPEAATRVLEEALKECPAEASGTDCRTILQHSLVTLQSTMRESGSREESLRSQVQNVERILADNPTYRPAVDDLVLTYRQLGQRETAIARLESVVALDPTSRGHYSLVLGDLYASGREWSNARKWYEDAIQNNPESQSARFRLITIYRAQPEVSASELIPTLREWESTFPEVARDGYELVIRKSYRSRPEDASAALERWTALSAEQDLIGPEILEALPSDWDSEALSGLREYVQSPLEAPRANNWWLASASRRNVLAGVGLALGRNRNVTTDRAVWSQRCWTTAMGFSPRYEEYFGMSGEDSVARLELASALADLYADYPSLDPDYERFTELERDLFAEKAVAYELSDLASIQRSHEALSRIYAKRGIWRPQDHPNLEALESAGALIQFANAIFQLEHVLDTAVRREGEGDPFQPLPETKQLLAQGYAKTGDERAARTAFLKTAMALLDVDNLRVAAATMDELGAVWDGNSSEQRAAREQITRLLRLRQRIDRNVDLSAEETVRETSDSALGDWLFDSSADFVRRDFLSRQHFKLLGDVAATLAEPDEPPGDVSIRAASLEAAARALLGSVDAEGRLAGKRSFSLVGTRDLIRIRTAQTLLQNALGFAAARAEVRSRAATQVSSGVVPLDAALVSTGGPSFIWLARDALLAARIVEEVGARELIESGAQFRIQDGNVEISMPRGESPPWARRIRELRDTNRDR